MTAYRSVLAAAIVAMCSVMAFRPVSAAPIMDEADFTSAIDETVGPNDSSTQRLLSRSNVQITVGGTELTLGNADSDSNPTPLTSWIEVNVDPTNNSITVIARDTANRGTFFVDFIEVTLTNIVLVPSGSIVSVDVIGDNLVVNESALPVFRTVTFGTDSIVLRWEEDNATGLFAVAEDNEASFSVTTTGASDIPEPGTLALLGAALVCMGAFARRRVRRG